MERAIELRLWLWLRVAMQCGSAWLVASHAERHEQVIRCSSTDKQQHSDQLHHQPTNQPVTGVASSCPE